MFCFVVSISKQWWNGVFLSPDFVHDAANSSISALLCPLEAIASNGQILVAQRIFVVGFCGSVRTIG